MEKSYWDQSNANFLDGLQKYIITEALIYISTCQKL